MLTGDMSVNEGGESATITVSLDNAVQGGFTVEVATMEDSAVSADYTIISPVLTFTGTAGEEKTFVVSATDDDIAEGDETFTVSLDNFLGTTLPVDSMSPTTFTIIDNDLSPSLTVTGLTFPEDIGTATLTLNSDKSIVGGFSVEVSTVNGSATAPEDYTAFSQTITFGEGETDKTFTVDIQDDSILEENETFNIDVVNAAPMITLAGLTFITPGATTVTITDDDSAALMLTGDMSVNEGGESATITVSLDNAVQGGFTVEVATMEDSAVSADYTIISPVLTFTGTAGEEKTFVVSATDDDIAEGDETFTVSLDNFLGTTPPVGGVSPTTFTIIDNDLSPSLTVTGVTVVPEDIGTATLTLNSDKSIVGGFSVEVSTVNGSATAPEDYTAFSQTITFGEGETDKTFTVDIQDNSILEENETFNIDVVNAAPMITLAGLTFITPGATTVTITDDDSAALMLTGDMSVNEGGESATITVSLDNAVQGGFTVEVATMEDSAVSADYTIISPVLTFTGTEGEEKTFVVSATDDDIAEGDETFTVSLDNFLGTTPPIGGVPPTTFTIIDNDLSPSLTVTGLTFPEDIGTATLTLNSDKSIVGGFSVEVSTVNGSATAPEDYTAFSQTITFGEGETDKTFTVDIQDNSILEENETFNIDVVNAAPMITLAGLTFITPGATTVTITDDDSAALMLTGDMSVNEGGESATITVSLDNAVQGGFTVEVATMEDSAVSADYTIISPVLTFTGTAGEEKTFVVSATDDDIAEGDETFTVSLDNFPGTTLPVGGVPPTTFTIIDNDLSPSLTVTGLTFPEDIGTATLTLNSDKSIVGGFSVEVSTVNGSATAPEDYTAFSQTITFGEGDTDKTFTVDIQDNSILEEDETFNIDVVNAAPMITLAGLTFITPGATTVTITDDDSAALSIGNVSVNEGEVAVITVTLDNAVQGGFTVEASTSDGTAMSGDYTAVSSQALTFTGAMGETQTFTVSTTPDEIAEGDETFTVSLDNFPGTTLPIVGVPPTTFTIIDNDLSPSLTVTGLTFVPEDIGTATLTLNSDKIIVGGFSVEVSTVNGSATAPEDYTAFSQTITFGEGETVKTFTVDIQDNSILEEDETFNIDVVNAAPMITLAGLTFITPGATTVTITDDDSATLMLTGDMSVNEGGESATITVSLDNAVQGGFTVEVATMEDSAVSADYTIISPVLTFTGTAGEEKTFVVSATDDDIAEGDETFTVSLDNFPGTTLPVGGVPPTTFTIIDNDLSPSLTVTGLTFPEDIGTATLTLNSDKSIVGGFSVEVSTVNGSATAPEDYTAFSQTITFGEGETDKTFTVDIQDNSILEEDETFNIDVVNAAPMITLAGLTFITPGATTVTITDDDSAALSIGNVSVNEGEVAVITVTLDNAVQGGFTVEASTSDGTAMSGDYTAVSSQALTFTGAMGETQTFTVSTTPDEIAEGDETFTVSLDNFLGTTLPIVGVPPTTFTIIDNDLSPSLTVTGLTFVPEDIGTATLTLNSDKSIVGGFSVEVSTVNGSATAPEDYTAFSQTITFGEGDTDKTFTVDIQDNSILEEDETFNIDVVNAAPMITLAGLTFITPGATTVTITDDDSAALMLTGDMSVNEGGESATITVSLDNAVQGGFTVEVATMEDSAVSADYTIISPVLTFTGTAGEEKTFVVSATDDDIAEGDETFTVSLDNFPGTTLPVDGVPPTTFTIIDNDLSPSLTVTGVTVVPEDIGTATLTLNSDKSIVGGFSVEVSTVNGSATAPEDYTAFSQTITFGEGDTDKTFTVDIQDNSILEEDETFNIDVVNAAPMITLAGLTFITPGATTVTITDDDSAALSIGNVSVNEGEVAVITVTLDNAVQGGFTVEASTSDGTAMSGDYTAVSSQALTFTGAMGETQTFTVSTTPDEIAEGDETFTVSLDNFPGTTLPIVGVPPTTFTIIDNDLSPSLTVTGLTFVPEDIGTATLTLNSDKIIVGGFSVEVSTVNGSATAPEDYTAFSQTITFGEGDTDKTFTVDIQDDSILEEDETFNIDVVNAAPMITLAGLTFITPGATTVTITDDDSAALMLTGDMSVNEGGESATITVSLDNAVQGGFTVEVATMEDSAVSADYTIISPVLTFTGTAGEEKTFVVSATDDDIAEGDETFTVSLDNFPGTTLPVGGVPPTTFTIIDNDLSPSLTVTGLTFPEDIGTATLTLNSDKSIVGGFSVEVSTVNGSATAPEDYTAFSQTITFGEGDTDKTFTVDIQDNSILEENETFNIDVVNAAPMMTLAGLTFITPGATTVTITDDDSATLMLTGDMSVNEGGESATITVSLDNAVQGGFTVEVATMEDSAVSADYTIISPVLTFTGTAGEEKTFVVSATDDDIAEGDETFTVSLDNFPGTTPPVGGVSPTTFTIIDNDLSPSLTVTGVTVVPEDIGTVTLTLNSDKIIVGGFSVEVSTVNGSATAPEDYTAFSQTITFGEGDTDKTFTVDIQDDSILEEDETFNIDVVNAAPMITLAGLTFITPGATTVTITDDDSAALMLTGDMSVNEGGESATITVSLDNAVQGGFTVEVATMEDSAVSADYTIISPVLTFTGTAGEEKTFVVSATDDDIAEGDETFTVSLDNFPGTTPPIVGVPPTPFTIIDNDLSPSLTVTGLTFPEDIGTATLTLNSDKSIVGGFSVEVSTVNGSATAPEDYTAFSQTITFGEGDTDKTFTVDIQDNSILEEDETFNIDVVNAAPMITLAGLTFITPGATTVTITDDDSAALMLTGDMSVNEGGESATITVSLDNAVQGGFTVEVATMEDSAVSADYTIISPVLTFTGTAGEEKTFVVSATDDDIAEGDETFTVSLDNFLGTTPPIGGVPPTTFTIIDNDLSPSLTVTGLTVVPEDIGTATLTLNSDKSIVGGFSVEVSTVNGSATAPEDYTAFSQTITFGEGDTDKTFTVDIQDDSILEEDETFNINVVNAAPMITLAGLTFITPGATTVTITDDDSAALMLTGDMSVNEGGESATITVSLDNAVQGGFTVEVATMEDSAVSADYTIISPVLTFTGTAGEEKTFVVSATDDDIAEGDETFTVSLDNFLGTTLPVDSMSPTTFTIIDNDLSPSLTVTGLTFPEDIGTATLTLNSDKSIVGGFSVEVSTVNGSATAPEDYTAFSQTITFGEGDTDKTFTVDIQDDSILEENETFNIDVVNAAPMITLAGLTFITPGATTVTITDDDSAALMLTGDMSVNEGGESATITVSLDNAVQGGFTVEVATMEDSAVSADYTIISPVLTFTGTAGEEKTFVVSATDDDIAEGDETFTVSLDNFPGTTLPVGGVPPTTFTIIDNDLSPSLTVTGLTFPEDIGTATLTLNSDKSIVGGFSVEVSTVNGSATAPEDYTAFSQTITFGEGDTDKTFTVDIQDNSILEEDETFNIDVVNAAPMITLAGLTFITPGATTVTITDDDSAALSIGNVSVNEGEVAVITVTLDNAVQGGFTVEASTSDGTAMSGDYTAVSSQALTFTGAMGETQTFHRVHNT